MQIAPAASASYGRRSGSVSAPPLTHHEIIGLIAPFTRRGRHADLAASDRIERRLAFRPIDHAAELPALNGIRETLLLENPRPDLYRLMRTLTVSGGLTATLTMDGTDPGALLAGIEAIPRQRQFKMIADHLIVFSHRLEATAKTNRLVLTSAEVRLKCITLILKAETGKGYPAEVVLRPLQDTSPELPDDLLAVLGRDWTVLRRRGIDPWVGSLRVRGSEPDRSRRLEAKLERTVVHLAQTLSEPPARFHERLTTARWRVAFRRLTPLLFCLGLVAGAAGLTLLDIPTDSMFQMLIFNLPPLLMMALFGMRELPRVEIPPLPRPSTATAWQSLSAGTD